MPGDPSGRQPLPPWGDPTGCGGGFGHGGEAAGHLGSVERVWRGACGDGGVSRVGAGLGRAAGEGTGCHSRHSWIQPSLDQGTLRPPRCTTQATLDAYFAKATKAGITEHCPPTLFLPVCLCEVGVSQHGAHAEPRHVLVLPGLPPALRGQRGLGQARGAPLGDVLTPRERALLRTVNPASRRLPAEVW